MSGLDAIRERHKPLFVGENVSDVCQVCQRQPWPCDAARLSEEVEALERSNTFLADPEFKAAMASKEEELALYGQRIAKLERIIEAADQLADAVGFKVQEWKDHPPGSKGRAAYDSWERYRKER